MKNSNLKMFFQRKRVQGFCNDCIEDSWGGSVIGFMLFLFVPLGIIVHLGYFTYSYFSSDLKEREKWYISPGQSIGGFFWDNQSFVGFPKVF